MKIFVAIISLLLFLCSCNGQSTWNNRKEKEYHHLLQEAVRLRREVQFNAPTITPNAKDSLLKRALQCVNNAQEITDTSYLLFVQKAQIEADLQMISSAIESLNRAISLRNDYAEGFFLQGLIYDKNGDVRRAREKYHQAIAAYDKRILDKGAIEDVGNRAIVFFFLDGRASALREINQALENYPENFLLMQAKEEIQSLKKEDFMNW